MTTNTATMTKADFLARLQEMLQTDAALAGDTVLGDLEEWDSLAFMLLIAFFDKQFGIRITFDEVRACATPADIIRLARGAIA